MFDVLCTESCKGDNGVVFKKGYAYTCAGTKDMVAVIHDDHGDPHIFYQREFQSCFKPVKTKGITP